MTDETTPTATATRPGSFGRAVTSVEELAEYYREPNALVLDNDTHVLDQGCIDFIAASPFVLVGTADAAS